MELTENERLMLVEKKNEIRKLTEEILELSINTRKNELELKKNVTSILSLISTIASYSKCNDSELKRVTLMANYLFHLNMKSLYGLFCNTVNSIRFNFTKGGLKIVIPEIDLAIFKA